LQTDYRHSFKTSEAPTFLLSNQTQKPKLNSHRKTDKQPNKQNTPPKQKNNKNHDLQTQVKKLSCQSQNKIKPIYQKPKL